MNSTCLHIGRQENDQRIPMQTRTTEEVFLDHLALAQEGDVTTDIERNFDSNCVLLTTYGTFYGHDGVRKASALLERQIGRAEYTYKTKIWHGEMAFLEWAAETDRAAIPDGADSFLIRHGRVQAMTIHYTVLEKQDNGELTVFHSKYSCSNRPRSP